MRTKARVASVVLLSVVLSLAVVLLARYEEKFSCSPTFLSLGEKEIVATAGSIRFGVRAVVLGCGADIREIRPEEMTRIRSILSRSLQDHGWRFLQASSDENLRRDLVIRINRALGRKVVSDIYAYSFSAAE